MIDTATETRCKNCGKPIIQTPGHRRREYCTDTCKQLAYRRRKAQPQEVTIVDDRAQQRIAELEQEVQRLQEQLNLEQRFRTDTQAWNFRRWIRQHQYSRWKGIDFFQRFLDDRRLHVDPRTDQLFSDMPKSLYLHRLHQYGYSEEEIALFKEAWIDMLFMEK